MLSHVVAYDINATINIGITDCLLPVKLLSLVACYYIWKRVKLTKRNNTIITGFFGVLPHLVVAIMISMDRITLVFLAMCCHMW